MGIRSIYIFAIVILLTAVSYGASQFELPVSQWVGSALESLGNSNPAVGGNVNALWINPASIASIELPQLSVSSKHPYGMIDYMNVNFCLPYSDWTIGLGFGTQRMTDIPETLLDDIIRQTGAVYSAGISAFTIAGARQFPELFGFRQVDAGAALKWINQSISSHNRWSLALDAGLQTELAVNTPFFDRIQVGAAIRNILSLPLAWSWGDSTTIPMDWTVGASTKINGGQWGLYGAYGSDGPSIGIDYSVLDSLKLRSGTDFRRYTVGLGALIGSASEFFDTGFDIQCDYAYTIDSHSANLESIHTFSISLIGSSESQRPTIISPKSEKMTASPTIQVTGYGPRKSEIVAYNGPLVAATTKSDQYGNWTINALQLKSGLNDLYVRRRKSVMDMSEASNHVAVILDQVSPTIGISVGKLGSNFLLIVTANEPLSKVEDIQNSSRLFRQTSDLKFTAELLSTEASVRFVHPQIPLLKLRAIDLVGNVTDATLPILAAVTAPIDGQTIRSNQVTVIGTVAPSVTQLWINDTPVLTDSYCQFATTIGLKPGKNTIFVRTQSGRETPITQILRVLMLQTYADASDLHPNRETMDGLITLRLLPTRKSLDSPITRLEWARTLNRLLKFTSQESPNSSYESGAPISDTGLIQSVVTKGQMSVGPTGDFQPTASVTMDIIHQSLGLPLTGPSGATATLRTAGDALLQLPQVRDQIRTLLDTDTGYEFSTPR